MRRIIAALAAGAVVAACGARSAPGGGEVARAVAPAPPAPSPAVRPLPAPSPALQAPAAEEEAATDYGWPRQQTSGYSLLTLYQPQLERWRGDRLEARAAVSAQTASAAAPSYAVVSFRARTAVDKPDRVVLLEDVEVRALTPSLSPAEERAVRQWLPAAVHRIALDRLQASLAATRDAAAVATTAVRNDPPRIVVTTTPTVLVALDGEPELRPIAGTRLERVINTRALVVRDLVRGRYYLYLGDGWLSAGRLAGPWSQAVVTPPAALENVRRDAVAADTVDLFDDERGPVRRSLARGTVPRIVVSAVPTEIIELRGEPLIEQIDGTRLERVVNTDAAIVRPEGDHDYYTLVSGRWYRSPAIMDGVWSFVATPPAELAAISPSHRLGWTRASIPGTAEARDAALANGIPQTATVRRGHAEPGVIYDGAPRVAALAGTTLRYVENSATPIIGTAARDWYALVDGVWLHGDAPSGPWQVATEVPDEIYDIPVSSRLYHVTYARIYGVTPEAVRVGYLPGYLGSYVGEEGNVVYGTGYAYRGWSGRAWFAPPATFGAGMRWSPGAGWIGAHEAGRVVAGDALRYAVRPASTVRAHEQSDLNHADVYRAWSAGLVLDDWEPVRIATLQPRDRAPGLANDIYAGRDGSVYRRDELGWHRYSDQGWQRAELGARSASAGGAILPSNLGELEDERHARRLGSERWERARAFARETPP